MAHIVQIDLVQDGWHKELEDITDFQHVVRLLMDTGPATRPDILNVVGARSCYNFQPYSSHMTAAKRVFQYPKCTTDFCLDFKGNGIGINIGNYLVGYMDSDWANDSADCTPQGSHESRASNGAILWQTRKKCFITNSSVVAGSIAGSEACLEAKLLLQLQNHIS